MKTVEQNRDKTTIRDRAREFQVLSNEQRLLLARYLAPTHLTWGRAQAIADLAMDEQDDSDQGGSMLNPMEDPYEVDGPDYSNGPE
ncbi:MAG: hypothetical protein LAQ30_29245 [Acidobacteriia bacterium]|nr:hypothetical protein [Terriglobia bacterium]